MKFKIKTGPQKSRLDIFKEYFDTYFDDIRNYLYYKSSDIDLSEDLSQEAFLKLWENIDNVKSSTVKSYLYTIARNLFNNHYNRKKVEFKFISGIEESLSESPQFIMELKEFDALLQQKLSEIPEKSREVFLMSRIDKLKYSEIADRLDISVKAVEKRMKKALEMISTLTQIKV